MDIEPICNCTFMCSFVFFFIWCVMKNVEMNGNVLFKLLILNLKDYFCIQLETDLLVR